ncbi:hypothetical protein ACGFT2_14985 [Streptomyces sp. NPDC048514]|uniref:hypothetical protein n=1 Tax=Streptomyces sp. NPDC048514 TaxID=3365564 RepID=UPI00371B47BC
MSEAALRQVLEREAGSSSAGVGRLESVAAAFGGISVLDAGRDDMDRLEQAERVGDQELLVALDPVACVEAPGRRRNGVGRADGLRFDQPCARLCVSVVGFSVATVQDVVDEFDDVVVVPSG